LRTIAIWAIYPETRHPSIKARGAAIIHQLAEYRSQQEQREELSDETRRGGHEDLRVGDETGAVLTRPQ
jgi:hypothetical protein